MAPYSKGTLFKWHLIQMASYSNGTLFKWYPIQMVPYSNGNLFKWCPIQGGNDTVSLSSRLHTCTDELVAEGGDRNTPTWFTFERNAPA